jgi:hypothetical protein
MDSLTGLYNQFLNFFPYAWHPYVSFVIAILLIYAIIKILQRDFIFLILLIVLLPASVPILKGIWISVLAAMAYLFSYGKS